MTESCDTRQAGRPKDLKKRQAILVAAERLFLSRGFGGASMEAVAAEAGVSKLTVYGHFENKEMLFTQVIRAKCEDHGTLEGIATAYALPASEGLLMLARRFMRLMFQPDTVAMHRLLIAESVKYPQISRLFYDAGPSCVKEEFAALLRHYDQQRELVVANAARATEYFFHMLKGEAHFKLTLQLIETLSDTEMEAQAQDAVAVFLRAYRV